MTKLVDNYLIIWQRARKAGQFYAKMARNRSEPVGQFGDFVGQEESRRNKNSGFSRFARAFSYLEISQAFSFFPRREMTCFAVVWIT